MSVQQTNGFGGHPNYILAVGFGKWSDFELNVIKAERKRLGSIAYEDTRKTFLSEASVHGKKARKRRARRPTPSETLEEMLRDQQVEHVYREMVASGFDEHYEGWIAELRAGHINEGKLIVTGFRSVFREYRRKENKEHYMAKLLVLEELLTITHENGHTFSRRCRRNVQEILDDYWAAAPPELLLAIIKVFRLEDTVSTSDLHKLCQQVDRNCRISWVLGTDSAKENINKRLSHNSGNGASSASGQGCITPTHINYSPPPPHSPTHQSPPAWSPEPPERGKPSPPPFVPTTATSSTSKSSSSSTSSFSSEGSRQQVTRSKTVKPTDLDRSVFCTNAGFDSKDIFVKLFQQCGVIQHAVMLPPPQRMSLVCFADSGSASRAQEMLHDTNLGKMHLKVHIANTEICKKFNTPGGCKNTGCLRHTCMKCLSFEHGLSDCF
eukprot:577588_1